MNQDDSPQKTFTNLHEVANQTYPFQINGQTYFAKQSYEGEQLLNGVQLNFQQAKGISENDQKIQFIPSTHQIVFCSGGNIIAFHPQRKIYRKLINASQIEMIRSYSSSINFRELDDMNYLDNSQKASSDYLVWTQFEYQKQDIKKYICALDCHTKVKIFQQQIDAELRIFDLFIIKVGGEIKDKKMLVLGIITVSNGETEIYYQSIGKKTLNKNQNNQAKPKNQSNQYLKPLQKTMVRKQSRISISISQDISLMNNFKLHKVDHHVLNLKFCRQTQAFLYSVQQKVYQLKFSIENSEESSQTFLNLSHEEILQSKSGQIIDFETNQQFICLTTEQQIQFHCLFSKNLAFIYDLSKLYNSPKAFQCELGLGKVKYVQLNENSLILIHSGLSMVSAFTVSNNSLDLITTNALQLDENISEIVKIYLHPSTSQVTTLVKHFENEVQQQTFKPYVSKFRSGRNSFLNTSQRSVKYYYEINTSYMALNTVRSIGNRLIIKPQKYINILTSPWLSAYFIQTQREIQFSKNQSLNDVFENVKCAALHPCGIFMLVGFKDSFKVYSVTRQGIVNTYKGQSVKDCQAVAYSLQGHHFAVATGVSLNIYNSYSSQRIKCISVCPGIQVVQDLKFTRHELICTMKNKRIFIFALNNQYKQIFSFNPKSHIPQNKQNKSNQSKEILITSIFYDSQMKIIIFSANQSIYFINSSTYQLLGTYILPFNITVMQYSFILDTLFLGTDIGSVICFPWPNKPINILEKQPTYYYHQLKVIKIKVTSDHKYLLTIGADGSMYKSSLDIIRKMKKIKQHDWFIQKKCAAQCIVCDILVDKGICTYTHTLSNNKSQNVKQLEDQSTSANFIFPQQRQKQKQLLINNIQEKKKDLKQENEEAFVVLKQSDFQIRNMASKLQRELITSQLVHKKVMNQQKKLFQTRLSQISRQRDRLRIEYDNKFKQYENIYNQLLQKQQNDYNQVIKLQQRSIKAKSTKVKRILTQGKDNSNIFYELDQIGQQIQAMRDRQIQKYQQEIYKLNSRNGQLMCRNNQLQQDTIETRRKIQDLKYLIYNIEQSIKILKKKYSNKQKDNSSDINSKIAEAQRNCMQAMKALIQKDREIDLNIKVFQKQHGIILKLQKALQNTQKQIDLLINDVFKQKMFTKSMDDKQKAIKEKFKILNSFKSRIEKDKHGSKSKLKTFLTSIYLYFDKSIDLKALKKKSIISISRRGKQNDDSQDFDKLNKTADHKLNEEIVLKRLSQQEKALRFITNEKKFYSTSRRKMHLHNQDLVSSFNELSFENKHLHCIMKTQQKKKRTIQKQLMVIKRSSNNYCGKDSQRQSKQKTPFQKYTQKKNFQRRLQTMPATHD